MTVKRRGPTASPSKAKAQEILSDGTVHGEALTGKQEKFMRAIAHGWKPTGRPKRRSRHD